MAKLQSSKQLGLQWSVRYQARSSLSGARLGERWSINTVADDTSQGFRSSTLVLLWNPRHIEPKASILV